MFCFASGCLARGFLVWVLGGLGALEDQKKCSSTEEHLEG